jgi:hypothetical protein
MSKSTKKTTAKAAPAAKPAEVQKIAKLRGKRIAKATADTIIVSKGLATSNGTYVEAQNGKSVIVAPWQDKGATRKLMAVGGSLAALNEHLATLAKPTAQLANGVTAKDAPQSAKAVADQKKAPAATKGKGKARTEKAAKAKQPSRGTDRAYVAGSKKDESKPDTFRKYMLTTILKAKSTAAAKAAHAKSGKYPTHKLDFNWSAQQGYIKFVD